MKCGRIELRIILCVRRNTEIAKRQTNSAPYVLLRLNARKYWKIMDVMKQRNLPTVSDECRSGCGSGSGDQLQQLFWYGVMIDKLLMVTYVPYIYSYYEVWLRVSSLYNYEDKRIYFILTRVISLSTVGPSVIELAYNYNYWYSHFYLFCWNENKNLYQAYFWKFTIG